MEVDNYPIWKEMNIGDTPIVRWTMIIGGMVFLHQKRYEVAAKAWCESGIGFLNTTVDASEIRLTSWGW